VYREGELLAGKYRVERLLGQGGMGVVVAARHIELQERVAVKLMLTDDTNEEAVQRFVREARAAARIESDHVAHVSDVGALEDGRAYLVMEYLDGQDLSQVLATRGRLPAAEAVDYLLQACEAIAEAHSIGIVHRDLKPSNLFLTQRRDRTPHVKVLDFGISKIGTPSQAKIPITHTSELMGSPLYMSPEQMTSTKDVDGRSDIWALGIVLYELLAAHAPFDGESLPQVIARVMQEAPPPLANVAPDLPPGLSDVVSRCLEKDPANRYQNLAELAIALTPYSTLGSYPSVERILRLMGKGSLLPSRYAPSMVAPAPSMLAPGYGPSMLAPAFGAPRAYVPSMIAPAPSMRRAPSIVVPAPGAVPADPEAPTVPPSIPNPAVSRTQTNWGDTPIPGLQRSKLPLLVSALAVVALAGVSVLVNELRSPATLSAAAAPVTPPLAKPPEEPPAPVAIASSAPQPIAPMASASAAHHAAKPTPIPKTAPVPVKAVAAPPTPVVTGPRVVVVPAAPQPPPPAAPTRSRF
jgi:eukaryotic-like serine/threonine-protein kinase